MVDDPQSESPTPAPAQGEEPAAGDSPTPQGDAGDVTGMNAGNDARSERDISMADVEAGGDGIDDGPHLPGPPLVDEWGQGSADAATPLGAALESTNGTSPAGDDLHSTDPSLAGGEAGPAGPRSLASSEADALDAPPGALHGPGALDAPAAASPTGVGPSATTDAGIEAAPAAGRQPDSGATQSRHPGTAHPLPRRLAIANQKGGVGKTTTAVNLGAALAELDYRVLVVDLDPQGNATTGLGVNGRNLDASIYDVILHDVPIEDVIEPTTLKNLFVVPATIDLAGAEIELVPVFSRELRLKRALEPVDRDFDFILIDCPPSLGLLTVNGLAAATEVAVPIQCEYYALEGLGQLLRNVGLVQANLNQSLDISTIILTMFDARTRLAEQVVEEVRRHFGDKVCRNVVPRTVRLSEAPSFGQPIIVFDSSSRGAIAYRELAKEVSGGASQRVG
jgi:chromosome partitioning protein